MLASQHPVRTVPNDPSEPTGERGRVVEGRQGVPGGDERFLDDVFGLAEVADERQRVAEGHVLEAPDDLVEGVEIASCRGPNRGFQVHRPSSPVSAGIRRSALRDATLLDLSLLQGQGEHLSLNMQGGALSERATPLLPERSQSVWTTAAGQARASTRSCHSLILPSRSITTPTR